eukprot:1716733-Prymnesium_polylepis.2
MVVNSSGMASRYGKYHDVRPPRCLRAPYAHPTTILPLCHGSSLVGQLTYRTRHTVIARGVAFFAGLPKLVPFVGVSSLERPALVSPIAASCGSYCILFVIAEKRSVESFSIGILSLCVTAAAGRPELVVYRAVRAGRLPLIQMPARPPALPQLIPQDRDFMFLTYICGYLPLPFLTDACIPYARPPQLFPNLSLTSDVLIMSS